jgi:hypothetical protein
MNALSQSIQTKKHSFDKKKIVDTFQKCENPMFIKCFSFLIGQKTCCHSKFLFLLDQYTKKWFSVVFSSETTVTGVSKLYRNGVLEFRYKNLFPIL